MKANLCRCLNFCVLLILPFLLIGQKVIVSNEISVRNNLSYDVLPGVGNHVLFYHDRGADQIIEIFDKDLRFKASKTLEFEKSTIYPIAVISLDSFLHFYYTYKDEGNTYVRVNKYDQNIHLVDSTTLIVKDRNLGQGVPRFLLSDDKSKILIFNPDKENLQVILIDNTKLEVISDYLLNVKSFNFKNDFEKIVLCNSGEFFIIGRPNANWYRTNNAKFSMVRVKDKNNIRVHFFNAMQDIISQIIVKYDEMNKKLVFGGFTTSDDFDKSNGYFAFSVDPDDFPDEAEFEINAFTRDFMADVTGKKQGKVRELSFFNLRDVVVRNDGGVLLVAELTKDFIRRSQMMMPGQFNDGFGTRGMIDYYHEDLIIFATHQNGKEHWKKLLFKKQFSQDDEGVYSSYFLFITPTRLRFIYNDEIKNANTVSEYVLDPLGNMERRSVLSTEYQNLKLRFQNAIQTSNETIIVPSEKSYKINLVKIDFSL